MYYVLLHLKRRLNLGDFFRLISEPSLATASNLLKVYARETEREMLRDYYDIEDRRVDSAILALEDYEAKVCLKHSGKVLDALLTWIAQDVAEKMSAVKTAAKFFSEDAEHASEAKVGSYLKSDVMMLLTRAHRRWMTPIAYSFCSSN